MKFIMTPRSPPTPKSLATSLSSVKRLALNVSVRGNQNGTSRMLYSPNPLELTVSIFIVSINFKAIPERNWTQAVIVVGTALCWSYRFPTH
eukprot:1854214-Amphidinium_carterae.1